MRRRRFLVAACGAATLAGCSRLAGGTTLDGVTLINMTREAVEVELRVERDGEAVHAETISAPSWEAEPGPHALRCEWPASPAAYSIGGRVVGTDQWVTVAVGDGLRGPDSALVDYRVAAPEHLAVDVTDGDGYPTDVEWDCGYREEADDG